MRMPGHVKMVKGAVDPDPTEYLLPSHEQRKEDQNKPFDSKKSVWVPDPKTGGYRWMVLSFTISAVFANPIVKGGSA